MRGCFFHQNQSEYQECFALAIALGAFFRVEIPTLHRPSADTDDTTVATHGCLPRLGDHGHRWGFPFGVIGQVAADDAAKIVTIDDPAVFRLLVVNLKG